MEIKIGKSSRACGACGRSFTHEEELRSIVRLHQGAFAREDFCKECWKPEYARGVFSVWSPRFYDRKVAEQEPPEASSPLRSAFYDAVEADDRTNLAMAYLAAHLLRRQKVFRLVKEFEEAEGGSRVALFEDRVGNRLIEVNDPNLTYAEIEMGRRVLLDRLETPEKDANITENIDHGQLETT